MLNRGKLVVIFIFMVALAMAGFALWWNWGLGRRSLEYWGQESGLAIRDAKTVQLMRLVEQPGNPDESGEFFQLDGRTWKVVQTKDVSSAQGLVHARHAFLEDASFQWDQPVDFSHPDWQYAVRFQADQEQATILLDLKLGAAGFWEAKRAVHLSPKTASGWTKFTGRFFPEEGAASPK
jgi:hypothetical protein